MLLEYTAGGHCPSEANGTRVYLNLGDQLLYLIDDCIVIHGGLEIKGARALSHPDPRALRYFTSR